MSLFSWLGKTIGLTDHAFFAAFFGARNSTGQFVTTDTAMTVAAAWACLRLLSESTGIIPMAVYRKEANGGRVPVTDHPVYDLVHDAPNGDFTALEHWEAIAGNLAAEGNALVKPVRFNGEVRELDFIHWRDCDVRVTRDDRQRLLYQFTFRGKSFELLGRDVIHYRGFGMGRDVGLSAIRYGANVLGIAMSSDDSAGRMFRNGSNASGFITTEKPLDKAQREQFTESLTTFKNTDDPTKIMLLPGGFKFEPTGIKPDDMQLLMSRGFSVEQVCSLFRIPPFMIGHTEKSSSYPNSLEQQILAFLTFALQPYLKRIEQKSKLALLSPIERAAGLYIEFNREALLQADSAAKASFLSTLTQNGLMTRNEGRDVLNLPRQPGADKLTVQSALTPLDTLGQVNASAQAVRQALKAWLADPDGVANDDDRNGLTTQAAE